jgi:hypothetical protein
MWRHSGDGEVVPAGPRATPHRGAPGGSTHGGRSTVRHPTHGDCDGEK